MKSAQLRSPIQAIKKIALFMDLDGLTNGSDAAVDSATLELLSALQKRTDGALAILSGRRISDLDTMLAPLKIVASGCLGAEMRLTADGNIYALAEPMPANVVHQIFTLAQSIPNVVFENKIYNICLNFADAPEAKPILEKELATILSGLNGLVKTVFNSDNCEIKRHNFSKGSAVRNFFLAPIFKGKMPVYIGNNILDRDAFQAVRSMGGVGMYVGKGYVMPDVDFTLSSMREVPAWLDDL